MTAVLLTQCFHDRTWIVRLGLTCEKTFHLRAPCRVIHILCNHRLDSLMQGKAVCPSCHRAFDNTPKDKPIEDFKGSDSASWFQKTDRFYHEVGVSPGIVNVRRREPCGSIARLVSCCMIIGHSPKVEAHREQQVYSHGPPCSCARELSQPVRYWTSLDTKNLSEELGCSFVLSPVL